MEYDYELSHEVAEEEYYCCGELVHEGDYEFVRGFGEIPDEYNILRDPVIRIVDLYNSDDQRIDPCHLTKVQYLDILHTMTQIYWDNFLEEQT